MTTATSSCRSASTPSPPGRAWTARRLEVADVRCWRRGSAGPAGGAGDGGGPERRRARPRWSRRWCWAASGVSPRTTREAEVVRRGAQALHVTLDLDGPGGRRRREIGFAPGRGRRLRIDGEPVAVARRLARAGGAGVPARRAAGGQGPARRPPPGPRPGAGGGLARVRRRPERPTSEALAQRNALLRRVRAGRGVGGHASRRGRRRIAAARGPGGRAPAARGVAAPGRAVRGAGSRRLGGGRAGALLRLEPSPATLAEVARGGPGAGPGVGHARAPAPRDPGRPDAVGAAPRRPLDRRRRGATCAARAARASSARPPWRCCWRHRDHLRGARRPADPAARRRAQRARPGPPPAAAGGRARRRARPW